MNGYGYLGYYIKYRNFLTYVISNGMGKNSTKFKAVFKDSKSTLQTFNTLSRQVIRLNKGKLNLSVNGKTVDVAAELNKCY